MSDAGYSRLGAGARDDPEGWNGKGGGRGDQDGEHMYTVVDSFQCMRKLIQYFIVTSLQKINN